MEKSLDEQIKQFLAVNYGSGYGDGSGYGSGSGSGDGSGDGYGYGYGDGYGDGYGYGYGYGYGDGDGSGDGSGIPEFNGQKVYQVDNVATLIDSVHRNYAKGRILNSDFTTTDCYIAKVGNYFAHGDTLEQAVKDARSKYEENLSTEDRISLFLHQYPNPDMKIPAKELYEWHHKLTGSCTAGRNHFAQEHGINIEKDQFTVREFIALTENSYGSDVTKQLKAKLNDDQAS